VGYVLLPRQNNVEGRRRTEIEQNGGNKIWVRRSV